MAPSGDGGSQRRWLVDSGMRSRAIRRHHEARMKERVQAYYGGVFRDDVRHVGKLAHTRAPCSCWMCGNPRRQLGEPSLQERRLEAADRAGKRCRRSGLTAT
jgi:hypothetical protein